VKPIILTRDLAYATGVDAANAQMRKAGRTQWNHADGYLAALTTNRLVYKLESPAIQEAMLRDGLV